MGRGREGYNLAVLEHPWTRWIPRLVLAVMAGAIPALGSVADTLEDAPPHLLEIVMVADTGGTMQVFYDRGNGVSEADSVAAPLAPSPEAHTYQFPLPLGSYRLFRIDPNGRPGRYEVRSIRILNADGDETARIPLGEIRAAAQVSLETVTGGSVAIVTTPDANDPQVLYEPSRALLLTPGRTDLRRAATWFALTALAVLVLVILIDRSKALTALLAAMIGMTSRRPYLAVVLAGVLGSLVAMYPVLLGRSLVSPGNGPTHMLYDQPPYSFGSTDREVENARGADVGAMMWAILPYTMVQREALAHGEFPLWNRYNTIGEPLWGQAQTFFLDPFHLASLAIPDPSVAMDLRFIVGRVVFAVGSGLTVAVVTGNGLAAVLVALLAPFVGHFTARFNHPAYFSIVYAPWILFAYARLGRVAALGDRGRAGAWLALATWLQLVGSTPKEGVVALIAAHAAGMLGLMVAPGAWKDKLGRVDFAVLGGVTATLAAAPHWWVFLDTLGRSWTLYDTPSVQFAAWPHTVGYVLGAAAPGFILTGASTLPVMAALCALVYPGRLLRSGVGLGAALACAGIGAVAYGMVPAEVLLKVPLLPNIHHIANSFLAATLPPLLLVAGVGIAAALDEAAHGAPVRLAYGAAAATVLCASVVPGSAFQMTTIVGMGAVIGAAAALLTLPFASGRLLPSGALALVLAAMTALFTNGLQFETGVGAIDALLIQPRTRADLDTLSPALASLRANAGSDPYRVAPLGTVLFPGTQALWYLEGIGGPDALRLPAIESMSDAAGVERMTWGWWTVLQPATLPGASQYLDMLNVRYLVARTDMVPDLAQVLPMKGPDLVRVVARPSPWPRAFFTGGVSRHRGPRGVAEKLRSSNGPFSSVDEQDVSAVAAVTTLPTTGSVVSATDYVLTPNSTSFHVRTSGPGLAVLSEGFVEHDFQATLNGETVPYLRVNHALKGVVVPSAGDWTVRFVYRPQHWTLSWMVAGVGLSGFLALLLAKPLLRKP
jgi:hypothetical protein